MTRQLALAHLAAERLGINLPIYDREGGPYAWIEQEGLWWTFHAIYWGAGFPMAWHGTPVGVN